MQRRHFLTRLAASGFLLTPLAAFLAACGKSGWPDGMVEIKWDRDACPRCSMIISDRRFAVEMRGGPNDTTFKFDDIGCLSFWMRDKAKDHPWMAEAATRIWVADFTSKADNMIWLDARKAHFVSGKKSPMGYGYAAFSLPQPGSQDFSDMREHVVLRGK